MKEILNAKVKHREPFRPFAPSVCQEDAHVYFDVDVGDRPAFAERHAPGASSA